MASICIICQTKVYANRQVVTCGLCQQVAHRTCTDISRSDYQKEQKKGRNVDWHCSTCWNNISQNEQLCRCSFCHNRRMAAISFEFPWGNTTVSAMETSQPLSPVRNPDVTTEALEPCSGMHVSSWRTDQLSSLLDNANTADNINIDHRSSISMHSSVNASDESGPTWIQPESSETVVDNTAVEMECMREPIVSENPPSVTFIVSAGCARRGGVIITANPYGWQYFQESKPKYFTCTVRNCKGRLIVKDINDTSSFKMKGYHICAPNLNAQINTEMRQKIKIAAKENPYTNASDLAKKVYKEVIPESPSQPLTGVVSMKNLCKQGNRARQDQREQIPRSMEDLLQMNFCKEQFPENFFRWDIKVSRQNDERRHIFFATEKQMTYLAMAAEWRIDSTFKLVAPPFTQLFSIHSPLDFNGKVKQYALGYVLMSGKRNIDYQCVFEEIVKTLEGEHHEVKVNSFLLDYEVAEWQGIRQTFDDENLKIRGCWFHLSQSVIRKVHDVGLMGEYHGHGIIHKFVRQLTALPLLNAGSIPSTFYYMVDKVCQTFNYSRDDFDDPLKRKDKINRPPPMIRVFQYFEDQWINGKNFNPKDWTCFGTKVRSNNTLESWNGQVNREGGNKGMHIFKLGRFLHKYTEQVENIDMRLHMWGSYDSYQKPAQRKLNEKIDKLWKDYKEAKMNPWSFVKRAALILDPCIPPDIQNAVI